MTRTEFRAQLAAAKAYREGAPRHWPVGMSTAREDDLLTSVLGFIAQVADDADIQEMAEALHQMLVAREAAQQSMDEWDPS